MTEPSHRISADTVPHAASEVTQFCTLPQGVSDVTEMPFIDYCHGNVNFVVGHCDAEDSNNDFDHVSSSKPLIDSSTPNSGIVTDDLFVGESCHADGSDYKLNSEDDKVEEMEALLLRDQLLRSLTSKHQKPVVEPRTIQVNILQFVIVYLFRPM